MIKLIDACLLAQTKLRSKKQLVLVTTLVPGLLFALLIAAAVVAAGVANSTADFTRSALGGKYLVEATPVIPNDVMGHRYLYDNPTPELRSKLEILQKEAVEQRQQLAHKYGVSFNESSVEPLFLPSPFGQATAGAPAVTINMRSLGWNAFVTTLQQDWATAAPNTVARLKEKAGQYGATDVSANADATISYATNTFLSNGEEDILKLGVYKEAASQFVLDYQAVSVRNSLYTFTDQSNIERFILPENEKRQDNHSAIPVVMTYKEAEAIFGKKYALSSKPTGIKEQIAWIQSVQDQINGETFTTCYRSTGETNLISKIIKDNSDTALNEGKAGYAEPKLQYSLPSDTCGAPTVTKDTRTAAEKASDLKLIEYEKASGTYQPKERQLLTFQVVGLMDIQAPNSGLSTDMQTFITSVLGARYNSGAFIPRQMYDSLPDVAKYSNVLQNTGASNSVSADASGQQVFAKAGVQTAIVAFPTIDQARDFIANSGCSVSTPVDSCNKPWILQTYGVNYLLMDDFSVLSQRIARVLFPAVLSLALIIIFITMARVIMDSRRETAVFRALGAKRIDIVAIYVVYSLMIATLIIIFSTILGFGSAFILNQLYAPAITEYARVAYGVFDTALQFTFFSIPWYTLLLIVASIVLVSLIALLQPLIRNVRRSPLSDMRQE